MTDSLAAYKQSAIESAPPLRLVQMMYEGAIRFLNQAEGLDAQEQREEFLAKLNRATDVVLELSASLDDQHAPEISMNLRELYLFIEERILVSIMTGEKGPIGEARKVLHTLLEAWKNVTVEPA